DNYAKLEQSPEAMGMLKRLGLMPDVPGGGKLDQLKAYFDLSDSQKKYLTNDNFEDVVGILEQLGGAAKKHNFPVEQMIPFLQSIGGIEGLRDPKMMQYLMGALGGGNRES
ncbi:MAG: hypothetical protein EB165_07795, partial [Euryarchaeota archaeon]|nr:hypothetical protein [Euryarchaeota archaeon]